MRTVWRCDPVGVGGTIHKDSDLPPTLEQENMRTNEGGTKKMSTLDRKQAYDDMATPDTALQNLVNAESELYLQGDGIDRRTDERPVDRHDSTETPDEALEHMKQAEANLYLKGDK